MRPAWTMTMRSHLSGANGKHQKSRVLAPELQGEQLNPLLPVSRVCPQVQENKNKQKLGQSDLLSRLTTLSFCLESQESFHTTSSSSFSGVKHAPAYNGWLDNSLPQNKASVLLGTGAYPLRLGLGLTTSPLWRGALSRNLSQAAASHPPSLCTAGGE